MKVCEQNGSGRICFLFDSIIKVSLCVLRIVCSCSLQAHFFFKRRFRFMIMGLREISILSDGTSQNVAHVIVMTLKCYNV